MLWDSLITFYDYRGVIFGINDSGEMKAQGISKILYDPRWDLAYYLYGKNEYAQLIRNVAPERRDLLFGVEEFPDDFVVHFDYVRGEKEHIFDCLTHLHGLYDTEGISYQFHTEQLEDSPLSSAQFITDCNWYEMENGAKLRFLTKYSETKNNGNQWMCQNRTGYNENGIVKTDLYLAYPKKAEVIIGCDPEYQGVNKQLFYSLEADGEILAGGHFGAWILGKNQVNVDISQKEELILKVKVNQVKHHRTYYYL